jgi:uncharacterized protein (TIGR03086 family)
MDTIDTMGQVIRTTNEVVAGVRPDQLDDPTPCAAWNVRQLLDHLYMGSHIFSEVAEKGACPPERVGELAEQLHVTEDYVRELTSATSRTMDAWRTNPDVLGRTVTLPFGEFPGDIALQIAVCDVLTHAWDLAKATGQSREFDVSLCEEALGLAQMLILPELRDGDTFKDPQPVGDDVHPADRLAAFAGRSL